MGTNILPCLSKLIIGLSALPKYELFFTMFAVLLSQDIALKSIVLVCSLLAYYIALNIPKFYLISNKSEQAIPFKTDTETGNHNHY